MEKKKLTSPFKEEYNDNYSYNNSQIYNPFESPCLPKSRISIMTIQNNLASSKILFETDDDIETDPQLYLPIDSQQSVTTMATQSQIHSFFKLFQSKIESNIQKNTQDNKQNNSSNSSSRVNIQEEFSFGRRMRVKYPQTPYFKKLLKNNFPQFIKQFSHKFQYFEQTKDVSNKVPPVQLTAHPADFQKKPYKFYLGIAQSFKKQQAIYESQIFHRVSIYLQPTDELVWQISSKLLVQLGHYQKALILLRTGLIATKSEILLDKYLKYFDKGKQAANELPAIGNMILEVCNGKVQKFMKYLIQLSHLCYKNFSEIISIRILLFLYNRYQSCSSLIIDIIKILEIDNKKVLILELLQYYIENKFVKHPIIFQYYIKHLQNSEDANAILQGLGLIQQRIETSCVKDSKSRIYLDLAEAYRKLSSNQKYIQCLKKAFDNSKEPFRYKIYFMICSYYGVSLPNIKNIYIVLQTNKQNFIKSSSSTPIIYNFNEWKYYLHYSLFYLFNNHQPSYDFLLKYSQLKCNSGRIHAELIWIDRIKLNMNAANQRWMQCVLQMPKSGEIWCQGGRIMMNQGKIYEAMRYFKMATQLTPQYGDPFIQLLNIYMIQGSYIEIKKLQKKVIYSQPNYGCLWYYLKTGLRSSTIDIWKKAKYLVKQQLYKWNINYIQKIKQQSHLTAICQFNELFFKQGSYVDQKTRQKLYSLYDQLE